MTATSLRNEFPTLEQQVNGKPLAYLDSAATTQRPRQVLEAMDNFYRQDNANVHRGVHTLSMRATDKFEAARAQVAKFINAKSEAEIVFTKGCTEAINLVAASWGRANLGEGDVVLISEMEHHSNIVPWQTVCAERKATIVPVPVNSDGSFNFGALSSLLVAHPVKLVCVKHVCNAIGTINPIGQIVMAAHKHGALVVVDGAQSMAHVRVDVADLDVDFCAMAGHKVYGPMGIGALYGKKSLLESMPPYQTGGGMIQNVTFESTSFAPLPEKFEPGTPNVAGAIGFGAALKWVSETGVENLALIEQPLAEEARTRLAAEPGLRIVGSADERAGIVSFVMEQAHPHDVGTILDSEGVAVRSGHHCCQPLMKSFGVPATTRASFAGYSSRADVEALVRGVQRVAEIFR